MNTIATAVLAFVPVLFWGYLFSYFDNAALSGRRFLAGLAFGGLAIGLILSFDSALSFLGLTSFNPFGLVALASGGALGLSVGYVAMVLILAVVVFALGTLLSGAGTTLGNILLAVGAFLGFGVLFLLSYQVLVLSSSYGSHLANPLRLEDTVYASAAAVFLYYTLVGVSEEAAKHFGFLSGYASESATLNNAVVSGAFVALGFAFIENILYLANIVSGGSLLSGMYWQTLGYRSVFSVLLHVLCSSILAAAFFRSFSAFAGLAPLQSWLRYAFFGVVAAVFAHAVFNSSIVLGFPGIVFAYLVGGYLYFTSMIAEREPYESEAGYL